MFRAQRQCLACREAQLYLPASPLLFSHIRSSHLQHLSLSRPANFLLSVHSFSFPPSPLDYGCFSFLFLLLKIIHLFIICLVLLRGSPLLSAGFLAAVTRGYCVGFSLQCLLLLEYGPLECGLRSCGAGLVALRHVILVPGPGINLCPHWQVGFLTTRSPGKSLLFLLTPAGL